MHLILTKPKSQNMELHLSFIPIIISLNISMFNHHHHYHIHIHNHHIVHYIPFNNMSPKLHPTLVSETGGLSAYGDFPI